MYAEIPPAYIHSQIHGDSPGLQSLSRFCMGAGAPWPGRRGVRATLGPGLGFLGASLRATLLFVPSAALRSFRGAQKRCPGNPLGGRCCDFPGFSSAAPVHCFDAL